MRAPASRLVKAPSPRGHRFRLRSNQLGVHALVFSGDWSAEGCVRAVSGAKRAGFDLIEVPLFNPDALDVQATTRALQEHGMAASTSLGLPPHCDIACEDADAVARGVELLVKCVEKTHAIGAKHMVGVIMSALRKYPGPCTPTARANVVASIRRVADRAADLGVTLGLEVVNRYETNVINTAAEGMELLSDIARPNVTVHLDTYHMNIEEDSMRGAVLACGDKLGYVHIGESHRGYLGTGSVDFKQFFQALAEARYTGPVTFESFSSAIVSADLSNNLCVWRNLWDDSDDLALSARQYIGEEMQRARRLNA